MEIWFDTFQLAGDGDANGTGIRKPSGPSDVAINGSNLIQKDEFIRGEFPTFRDRGNETNALRFTVTRQHADYAAAAAFCITHKSDLPGVGNLKFIFRHFSGAVDQRLAKGAALLNVVSTQRGVSTNHTYQFEYGELQKAKVKP